MDREMIDEWVKRGQLGITLALLAFAPIAWGSVRPSELVVVQWGILLLTLLWVARLWLQSPFRFWLPPVTWAVVPFVVYAGWRYTAADVEFVARQEFLQIVFFTVYLLVITNNLHGQNMLRGLAIGLVCVATLISMYAIYQWLTGSQSILNSAKVLGYYGRASGTYVNPNHFSALVEMALPLAIAMVVSGRLKALSRIFLGYAAGVMLVGIAVSGSRGGWICAGLSLLVLVLVLATRRGFRLTTLALAAAIFLGGYWLYSRTIQSRVENTYLKGHERESRLWIWEAAVKVWQESPWLGVGPDHFDLKYRAYRQESIKNQGRPGRVHNDYLNTMVDYGVLGLLLALLPIGVAAASTIRNWRYLKRSTDDLKGRESNRSALVLGAGCGLIAILVHSFFDFNMHIPANALVAVTLLGILISHQRFATTRWWVSARWPVLVPASLVLAVTLALLGEQTVSRTRGVLATRRAEKSKGGSPEEIAALKVATEAEPGSPDAWFKLGEHLRALAFVGGSGNEQAARNALPAFDRAIKLNPWDPIARIRYGMCLDWLERYDEALPYFKKALELDPNYHHTRFMLGWHYYHAGDLTQALNWIEKSLAVSWLTNDDAVLYRSIIRRALADEKKPGAVHFQ